jgi:hypothetical protein
MAAALWFAPGIKGYFRFLHHQPHDIWHTLQAVIPKEPHE